MAHAESRAAESKKDVIHKLGIALKELRETRIWLRRIVKTELLRQIQSCSWTRLWLSFYILHSPFFILHFLLLHRRDDGSREDYE